jgi:hypothetical protein
MRNLKCNFIPCDEIWTFCFKKQKRVRKDDPDEFGDQWVFVAIDAKLVPSFPSANVPEGQPMFSLTTWGRGSQIAI